MTTSVHPNAMLEPTWPRPSDSAPFAPQDESGNASRAMLGSSHLGATPSPDARKERRSHKDKKEKREKKPKRSTEDHPLAQSPGSPNSASESVEVIRAVEGPGVPDLSLSDATSLSLSKPSLIDHDIIVPVSQSRGQDPGMLSFSLAPPLDSASPGPMENGASGAAGDSAKKPKKRSHKIKEFPAATAPAVGDNVSASPMSQDASPSPLSGFGVGSPSPPPPFENSTDSANADGSTMRRSELRRKNRKSREQSSGSSLLAASPPGAASAANGNEASSTLGVSAVSASTLDNSFTLTAQQRPESPPGAHTGNRGVMPPRATPPAPDGLPPMPPSQRAETSIDAASGRQDRQRS
jgi:hypothetical protein